MNNTTRGERIHIGIFGNRNTGKSSLINAITNQNISLVSDHAGTTTDPVYKSMELLPVGPVVFIDTAGIDDKGELGKKRIKKSIEVLNKSDIAVIVTSQDNIKQSNFEYEKELITKIKEKNIPLILAFNKIDLEETIENSITKIADSFNIPLVKVSSKTLKGIDNLKQLLIKNISEKHITKTIVGDLLSPGDIAILVTPIDNAAPKGRLILPQVQTIRDILDSDCQAIVVKEQELSRTFKSLNVKPKIVITDSQAFQKVAADTPNDIMLTSFSILFARYKGDLETYVKGIKKLDQLKENDKILISEGCTHHVQSDDIGTVKLPRWIQKKTGLNLQFDKISGYTFPDNLNEYSLVIHCGACMLNSREVMNRISIADNFKVPITNYGITIAWSFGILERALKPFPGSSIIYDEDLL